MLKTSSVNYIRHRGTFPGCIDKFVQSIKDVTEHGITSPIEDKLKFYIKGKRIRGVRRLYMFWFFGNLLSSINIILQL